MRTCHTAVTATVILLLAAQAQAGHFCDYCGCQRDCKKVCRLETKTKKKKDVEYSCEREDFCVPGPSKRCGYLVDPHCDGHPRRKFVWTPTWAKIYTRKKLVVNEVTKEVPDHKWVVDEYCCVCGHYIKVEDEDKGDDKGGGAKGAGDPYKKTERPTVLLSGAGRGNEVREGEARGYYWDDIPNSGAVGQTLPSVTPASDSAPAARLSRTSGNP